MKRNTVIVQFIVFIAIIIVINLISQRIYFRLDFTEDKRYTLSDATVNILEDLDDVITVNAYFTEDLPSQLTLNKKEFEDLLIEYEKRSGGNVVYTFINPNESQEKEGEAQQKGINPIIINVTESDQVQQLRAYMGAVIQMGERTEIIPLIQPGNNMEYDLTTSIKKLVVIDKPKIGFISGHGEPALQSFVQLLQQLSVLYDVEPIDLNASNDIPLYYRAVALINPTDTIPNEHLAAIDKYINNGGSIFLSHSTVQGDLNSARLTAKPSIGLTEWLRKYGIQMEEKFVVDATCASVGVRQQQGPFVFNTQIQFPFFPVIGDFEDHPISKGIESLLLPFTNPVVFSGDSSINYHYLAYSSENTGLVAPPSFIDINRKWELRDFVESPQSIAIAVENPTASGSSKMVVIGNDQFVVNAGGPQGQQVSRDNINFASNSIDWLADDTGLVDLRTKGVTNRPIKQMEDTEKAIYKYGNVIIPILLILFYAFYRRQRNLKKRNNWLQGKY